MEEPAKDIAVNIETGFKTVLGVIPSLTWPEGMSKTQNVHGQVWEWTVHVFFFADIKYLQRSGDNLSSNVRVTMSWYNVLWTVQAIMEEYGTHLGLWNAMWCFVSKSRLCLSAGSNMSPLFHQSIAMIDGWYCTEVSDPFSDTNVLLTQCKNKKTVWTPPSFPG